MGLRIFSFLSQLWWHLLHFFRPEKNWRSGVMLQGRTVVLTGGSSGIGRETARDLCSRGARVIIGCRDTTKAENAFREQVAAGGDIVVKKLDLASFASIRRFAEEVLAEVQNIHILINNAAAVICPKWKTEDGFEIHFGVNYLGHFLLTMLLLERLKNSSPARIVNVASIAHCGVELDFDDINVDKNYNPLIAYFRSKLAIMLFTRKLAEKLEGTGVYTYSLHPGCIQTDVTRHLDQSLGTLAKKMVDLGFRMFAKKTKNGIQTVLYCAIEETLVNESGCFYSGCQRVEPYSSATDDEAAEKLWKLSEALTGISMN